ncbi:MAG: TfoX/Sxy family protein [Bacteroidota bacterium]
MAYDTYQEERINRVLKEKSADFYSKKMMGGLCYMMDDKMLCGLVKDQFMARIGVDAYEEALAKEHVHEMNFTGRAMKGYVFVDAAGIDMDEDLEYWVQKCIDFNPMAKSSKKKKKK